MGSIVEFLSEYVTTLKCTFATLSEHQEFLFQAELSLDSAHGRIYQNFSVHLPLRISNDIRRGWEGEREPLEHVMNN